MCEKVLVIPAPHINFSLFNNRYLDLRNGIEKDFVLNLISTAFYMERDKAETDPNFKQVIPYCLVKQRNGSILCYERNKKSGENRLHNKFALGCGGHPNPTFAGPTTLENLHINLDRELQEELGLTHYKYHKPFGIIYDPSNEVGTVHIGLCFEVTPKTEDFDLDKFVVEDKIILQGFWNKEKIEGQKHRFENWSQILIENNVL